METRNQASAGGTAAPSEWSEKLRDWIEFQEKQSWPLYQFAFSRLRFEKGARHLDVGCGSGLACLLSAERGTTVSGVDVSAQFINAAQSRLPGGDFRVGDMNALPFADGIFDIVTGFNAFQFSAQPLQAFTEAHRVLKAGGSFLAAVAGEPGKNDVFSYLKAMLSLLPSPPKGKGTFALSDADMFRSLVAEAGFHEIELTDVECPWEYPDEESMVRALMSTGSSEVARKVGQDLVRRTTIEHLKPYRTARGGYRLRNTFHVIVAAA